MKHFTKKKKNFKRKPKESEDPDLYEEVVTEGNEPQDEEEEEDGEENLPKWYEMFSDEPVDSTKATDDEVSSLRIEAQTVLEAESKFYNSRPQNGKKKSNAAWIKTVMSKGTFKDRVAAQVVTIQGSPVYSLSLLNSLVQSVKAAKKNESNYVMDILADLFLEDLLRPGVKLKTFDQHPLTKLFDITSGCSKSRKMRLCFWLFEEKLKELYLQYIEALDNVGKDTVEANRIKSVSCLNKLLVAHPEQEQILLKKLINKLGDPSQKVVSKVVYSLTQLLRVHPNMKQIVLNEVEKLLFRTNLNVRTQYYSICFLSQFLFLPKEFELARNIIDIYFAFFKSCIKKGEVDSRLMGALLTGVRRAYPYAQLDKSRLSAHIDTLYKIIHLGSFGTALHALSLLQEVSSSDDDRFYSALYKKLLDPNLAKCGRQAMLINLIFKAISKDSNIVRVEAFIKRLLQICLYFPVPVACGFLYMISQVVSRRKNTLSGLKMDPGESQMSKFDDLDDDEEVYRDADREDEPEDEGEKEEKPASSWVFKDLDNKTTPKSTCYDPYARNPSFCNADKTAYFELLKLSTHFHPTVALFASQILNQEIIKYEGDPLVDFTITRFLERFVFKNPKKVEFDERGPDPLLAMRKYYSPSGVRTMNVRSDSYLKLDERSIPVDELFLFRYLKEKKAAGKNIVEDDDDNDSVASDEFEEMIDSMLAGKKKKNLDYLDDIGSRLSGSDKKDELQEEDDDEDDNDGSEEEPEGGSDVDSILDDDLSDGDDEAVDFGSDDDFEGDLDLDEAFNEASSSKKTLKSKSSSIKKKPKKDGLESLFAPAEEFAEILEDTGSSKFKQGMLSSVSNQDNAPPKQLDWEQKRDLKLRNDNFKNKRKWKGSNKTKTFKKQRK